MVCGKQRLVEEEVGPVNNFLLIFLCILCFGCESSHTVISNDGKWRVSFDPAPEDIPLNEMFEMRVWVNGNTKIKSVRVDAAMPAHGHGMMTESTTELQLDGSYLATGMLLHMPGDWELYFDISDSSSIERAQKSILLHP